MSFPLEFRRANDTKVHDLRAGTLALWLALCLLVPTSSFEVTLRLLDKVGFASWSPQVERRFNYQAGVSGKIWLGPGWDIPESHGIWTNAERSFMTIPLDRRTRRAELLIKTAGFLVPRRRVSQTVLVLVNGRQVATWRYQFGEPSEQYRDINIGPEDITQSAVQLEFVNIDPQAPRDLVLGGDERKLAMRLAYMLVREYF